MRKLIIIGVILLAILMESYVVAAPSFRRNAFESTDQFNDWYLSKVGIMVQLAVNAGNVTDYDGKSVCSDYAFILSDLATRDGYRMNAVRSVDGYTEGNQVRPTTAMGYHMGNTIVIGNSVYYIDPALGQTYPKYLYPLRDGHW